MSDDPCSSIFVSYYFVWLPEMWHKDGDDEKEVITWCNSYKQFKVQKAQIKKEFMSIGWHTTIDCRKMSKVFMLSIRVSVSCFSYLICLSKNSSHMVSSKVYNKDV